MLAQPTNAALERERLLAFSFTNADVLLELDVNFTVVFASGAIRNVVGRGERSIVGGPIAALFEARDRPSVAAAIAGLRPNARIGPIAGALRPHSGDDNPVTYSAYRLDGEAPRYEAPRYFVTIIRRARSAQEEIERALVDVQSGLLKGEGFASAAAQAQSRHPDSKLTMIELANLDALAKRLDADSFDDFIGEAGAVLRAASVDGEAAGRIGADKLGFVHTSKVDAAEVDARINEASRKADSTGSGLTVGHWTTPLAGSGLKAEQMAQVVRFAINSFAAKGLGEFHPASMNDVMHELVSDTVARLASVRDTIDEGRISIAYQPIVTLRDRRVHHWEALCRPHDDEGPGGVVRFAEQTGLAIDFDLLVVSKVFAALAEANAKGLKPTIALNLSARSIDNDMFLSAFRKLLQQQASVCPQLMIEITETERLDDLVRAENVIQELRRQRVRVCLDDFGSGASSFSYLESLSIDALKIDGRFVGAMFHKRADAAIVRAIVQMCVDLNIR
ncbi:MAG TPA: EAL domain-containing protein, partial [Alphaproteobacteria bacterium]|nr:EAL domain-containing protein [Alphaproteobacteria bacterium]